MIQTEKPNGRLQATKLWQTAARLLLWYACMHTHKQRWMDKMKTKCHYQSSYGLLETQY